MKKAAVGLLSVIILLTFACSEYSAEDKSGLTWHENLESAVKIAKEENKKVLVNFTGSDWCVWCKKLNAEVFTQKEFAEYAKQNLVLVKLDFPRSIEQSTTQKEYNNSLLNKYGVRGFPTILLFDQNGNPVFKTGYLPGGAGNYVKHLEEVFARN